MSICRQWSLVKHSERNSYAKTLYCRSWSCEVCQPRRRSQLLAQAASGRPQRFITLTARPGSSSSPRERLRVLAHSWRVIVKRLHRLHPLKEIEYMAVVEATKRGEPHLHILYRGPWIAQSTLSTWMAELADSPICDIRAVKNRREAIRYVAKYITKKPAQFGTAKRYWRSYHYSDDPTDDFHKTTINDAPWLVSSVPLHMLYQEYVERAWNAVFTDGEVMYAWRN